MDAYKRGEEVIIADDFGSDISKSEILKYLFNGIIDWDFVAEIIDEDALDSMIFAGSYETWNTRRLQKGSKV